jgi:hypothetical protein
MTNTAHNACLEFPSSDGRQALLMLFSAELPDLDTIPNCNRMAELACILRDAGVPYRLGLRHAVDRDTLVFSVPLPSRDGSSERFLYCKLMARAYQQRGFYLIANDGMVGYLRLDEGHRGQNLGHLRAIEADELEFYKSWLAIGDEFYTWEVEP